MRAVDLRTPIAAAVATVLGSLALSPVLTEGTWRRPAIDAVLVVLVVGLALRAAGALVAERALPHRRVPAALAALGFLVVPVAQLAAVAVLLTRRFTDVGALLPTRAGLDALGAVLGDGTAEVREQVAPAVPVLGLTALIALFVGIVAVVVDLVAVGARQAALAGPVLLVLVGVPVFTLGGDIGLLPVVAPAAALAVLLWADQSRRLDARGRTAGRRSAGGGSAARIGAVALLAGVLGGGLVPTFAEGTLNGGTGGGTGSTGTALDPVAAMYGQLTRNDPVDLLRMQTPVPDPGYLRAVTVDRYDAEAGWVAAGPGVLLPLEGPLPSGHAESAGRPLTASIQAVGHDDRFLPVPVSPLEVQVDGGDDGWQFDRISGTVVGADVTSGGLDYEVTASEVRPTPEQLAAAPPLNAGDLEQRFTDLPELDPLVVAQVEQLVAGAPNGYARVRGILDFLTDSSNGFTYSLSTAPGTSGDDLVDFLTERRGYCEQYAGAMAVMVRAAGMPARVALGYTPGTPLEDGTRVITSDDAHAWVEVYFDGYGWVPFDPTPIDVDRRADLPWAPRVATPDLPEQAPELPEIPPELLALDTVDPLGGPDAGPFEQGPTEAAPEGRSWPSRAGLVLLAAAAAAVPAGLRLLQRRRRLAVGTPQALWDELTATADDLGVRRDPAWTPREAGRALAEPMTDTEGAGAIAALARAEERASYGPATGEQEAGLDADLRTARRALRRAADRRARLRAAVWPASLPTALLAGVPAWARRRPQLPRSRRPGGRRLRAGGAGS